MQALITSVHPNGLNVQVLGFFEGTIDEFHLGHDPKAYKLGKKIKARILYDYSSAPPKFALSLAEHIVKLTPCLAPGEEDAKTLLELYPVGTTIDAVKVLRLDADRGLIVEASPGVEGFVHVRNFFYVSISKASQYLKISHTSDDHVPSLLASGPWKVGSIHPARVTGFFAFDGLLQLSMKTSVIEQKYLQVSDVEVGELVKGTIKKLTPNGLFVSLSGGIDGVVWPNHYADILLKHPAKRFKEGAAIKCRVRHFSALCSRLLTRGSRYSSLTQKGNVYLLQLRRPYWSPLCLSFLNLRMLFRAWSPMRWYSKYMTNIY